LLNVHHDENLNRFYEGSIEESNINPIILNTLVARQENHQHVMYDECRADPNDFLTESGATQLDDKDFQDLLSRVYHVSNKKRRMGCETEARAKSSL